MGKLLDTGKKKWIFRLGNNWRCIIISFKLNELLAGNSWRNLKIKGKSKNLVCTLSPKMRKSHVEREKDDEFSWFLITNFYIYNYIM